MKHPRSLALRSANPIRFIAFPALWLSLFAYAGRPLLTAARTAHMPPALAWSALLLCALAPMLPMLARRDGTLRRRATLHWIGYAVLGIFSLLLVLTLFSDVARAAYSVAHSLFSESWPLLDRVKVHLAVLGGAVLLSFVGLFQARCPGVRRVPVDVDDLPEALEGYRIVQWSDVHVGPTIRKRFLEHLVAQTNALDADAIAITGDLVDGALEELRDEVAPLADLRARDGVFYVTGNHEYYWRASEWLPHLERHGLDFLKNEHRVIARGGAKLVIAGVTDPVGRYTHKQDVVAALDGAPRDATKVLLSHRPQMAEQASQLGVDLQLSGHTHGGQFFPFNLLIRFFQPVVAGLHRVGRTWLYVSRGTGYWGPPSRLGVRGEVTVIELRRA